MSQYRHLVSQSVLCQSFIAYVISFCWISSLYFKFNYLGSYSYMRVTEVDLNVFVRFFNVMPTLTLMAPL